MKLSRIRCHFQPPTHSSSFLVEYSRAGAQHVGTVYARRSRQALFTIAGTEEYMKRTTRGIVDALEQAARRMRSEAFYCGANDNHEEGRLSVGRGRA
jgi:hypothetical protein